MTDTVFFEMEFLLLVACSVLVPAAIYGYLYRKRAIARWTVLFFASTLIALSGVDVLLLQVLATMARATPSTYDDRLFNSEMALALYLLPAVFAGIGVNLISHVLIGHLADAEKTFDTEHRR
ncbi:MAG: hypothetical protein IPP91_00200 [Betaproteobacteria bacterium]|nr:hypothetical protein [Betaproteobacteria bacterium]